MSLNERDVIEAYKQLRDLEMLEKMDREEQEKLENTIQRTDDEEF